MPVVDEQDALVGVVSVRDILRLAREMEDAPEALRWGLGVSPSEGDVGLLGSPEQGEFFAYYVTPSGGFVDVSKKIRNLPDNAFEGYEVEDIMTPAPVSIRPDATLRELARLLLDRRLHRALVVRDGHLVGIVTTTDVLKHLAHA